MNTKKELEDQYVQVKADIKSQLTMVKMYADGIQKSREKIDELSKVLTTLQEEYLVITQGEKDESNKRPNGSNETEKRKENS